MRAVLVLPILLLSAMLSGCTSEGDAAGADGSSVPTSGATDTGMGGPGGSSGGSGGTGGGDTEYVEGAEGGYACAAPGTEVKVDPNRTFEGGAHQHDMWGGQDRLTIFEGPVEKFGGGGWFEMPAAVVHPGTGRVEFVLSWTEQLPGVAETRRLHWDMPGDQKSTIDMFSQTFTKQNENHSIPVNLSNNDPPHASRSSWTFKLEPASATRVTWIIHRGYDCLPIDPPHYDLWQGATEKPVGASKKKYTGVVVCPQGVCTMSPAHNGFSLDGDNTTVPPGTSKVVVTLSWTNARPWPGKLAIKYATSATHTGSTYAAWKFPVNPVETGPTTRTYELPVAPEDWDSPYRTKSSWYYDWYFDNQGNDALLGNGGTMEGEISINAVAHRG